MSAVVGAPSIAAVTAPSAADFDGWMQRELLAVERALEDWVPLEAPAGLGEAMRYGVLDGGKRLRPLLALAACQAVSGSAPKQRCERPWRWS